VERSRGAIARVMGCHPSEIIFTSGATESNNLALSGVMWAARFRNPEGPTPHLIVSAIEHHAVLHPAEMLERQGFHVSVAPVGANGFVDPSAVEAAIRPETVLISVMLANNEVGAIQPVEQISAIARTHGVLMHTDAVQAAGAQSIDVQELGVDLLSLSAHKFSGPKGIGLLYVRKGTAIEWMQLGGGQESGRRGGTENVPYIVGFGAAIQRAEANRERSASQIGALRDRLWHGIQREVPDVQLNGPDDFSRRLPNNLNVSFPGVQGETMLLALDMMGVAASAGSACTTGNSEPSHVLLAMGQTEERARSSIRFSLGRMTTEEDIDEVVEIIAETVDRVRRVGGAR
jgi:cysteine desulfurase